MDKEFFLKKMFKKWMLFKKYRSKDIISIICNFLWGDLFTIPLPGGSSIGISLLVLLLIPSGIYFTIRTKFLPIRCFPEMLRISVEKKSGGKKGVDK